MPQAASHGITISYDEVGAREPALLMMPGWCADRSAFIIPSMVSGRKAGREDPFPDARGT
jgi:hypothetical protein